MSTSSVPNSDPRSTETTQRTSKLTSQYPRNDRLPFSSFLQPFSDPFFNLIPYPNSTKVSPVTFPPTSSSLSPETPSPAFATSFTPRNLFVDSLKTVSERGIGSTGFSFSGPNVPSPISSTISQQRGRSLTRFPTTATNRTSPAPSPSSFFTLAQRRSSPTYETLRAPWRRSPSPSLSPPLRALSPDYFPPSHLLNPSFFTTSSDPTMSSVVPMFSLSKKKLPKAQLSLLVVLFDKLVTPWIEWLSYFMDTFDAQWVPGLPWWVYVCHGMERKYGWKGWVVFLCGFLVVLPYYSMYVSAYFLVKIPQLRAHYQSHLKELRKGPSGQRKGTQASVRSK